MRRAVLAALGTTGIWSGVLALAPAAPAVGGCSAVAGYEDLRYVPGEAEQDGATLPALDLASASIYSVYPAIFSATANLAGVTAQLQRIHDLGFDILSLMPVTPVGAATEGHPAFNSPYCVQDYESINPSYGTPADLRALVQSAHQLGMYVILDEQINQTSWDNPLITAHPEYYRHDDAGSIEEAFAFADVAQLDYGTLALRTYITNMLEQWLRDYDIDGFRFLTADLPPSNPLIPGAFWRDLRAALVTLKPQLVLWADEEDPALAGAPFGLDYGWVLRGGEPGGSGAGLQQVAGGANATELEVAWEAQRTGYAGVLHTTLLQTWDLDEDIKLYGGVASTMAAATFNLTIDGVPLVWNGEEVGNDQSGPNTHTAIDWNGPNATAFTALYKSLLALRNGNSALRQGAVSWIANSAPGHVASYARSNSTGTFLVLVNFSGGRSDGTVSAPSASAWTDVSPAGSPGGTAHAAPPNMSLAAYDFAIFHAD